MKGQLVFEFVIATLFFLAIILYAVNHINTTVFRYSGEHQSSISESRAWQISELLVRSPGIWNAGYPDSLGLAEKWPRLSESKISDLNTLCSSDMDYVLGLLDIDPDFNGIKIEIKKYDGSGESLVMECGRLPKGIPNSKATRLAVTEEPSDDILKISVWYW